MKTLFVLLLLAVIGGAVGWQYYQRSQKPTIGQRAAALAERMREEAIQARDAASAKVEEWRLNPESIKAELEKTGRVVRSRAVAAGERMDDARIVAVIKGKYVMEKNLSSLDISVECRDGSVKLTGSVLAPDQIGQAIALALQTNGVHSVISDIAVRT